jgi:thioredoxin-like negative regulator of GroEL
LTALATALLIGLATPALAATPSGPSVAWLPAANDGDIDAAVAQARSQKKPLLLYWSASWCPPCNQLKATLFNRADFIARSQGFVAVHIDGDLPGAQKLGARFKVRGYPTLILMTADGVELTRLPGEADAPQVMRVLQLGMAQGRPIKAVLADAVAGKRLSGNEWRLLAFYGWDIDEAQLVAADQRASLLVQLASTCPPGEPESATRLMLKALADSDDGKGYKPDAALRQRVLKLLADAPASRAQMDVIVNQAPEITKALSAPASAERKALVQAFDQALRRLQADASLSRADRISALTSRVGLARLEMPKGEHHPKLPTALTNEVLAHAARDDREIADTYERQAVITADAYTLAEAGLWAQSESLLKANLAKSPAPYYLMSQLAGNARKLGQNDQALRWYEQAWVKSEGPATRLQWGASYFGALVELAPQDAPRIEQVATQLWAEAAQDPAAFHERSARSLQRVGSKLVEWNRSGSYNANLQRLLDGPTGLAALCAKREAADGQRATCEAIAKGLAVKKG